jgi:hypothetical protein
MRLRSTAPWAVLVLAVVLLLVGAACGGDTSSSATASPAATVPAGVTADQVVKDSEAKMAQVTSASFAADAGLAVQGDTSQISDPMTQALLAGGIKLHAEGASQTDPMTAETTISVGIAGQTLDLGLMSQDGKAWVGYQDQWYAVDSKTAKSLSPQTGTGASPIEQLKSFGLDPSAWDVSYTMVGAETIGGVQVYHVKGTADPQKLAAALIKAAEDPSLAKKLGGQAQLEQLGQSLQQNKQQAEQFGKALKQATVDEWIGANDSYLYKMQTAATLDTTGQKGMTGVDGVTLNMTVALSDFDQPVTVTPPASALPIKDLVQQLFGGLGGLGGLGGGSSF